MTDRERAAKAFAGVRSLHPLVVGHMCKQGKRNFAFSKRYFALYEGSLLAYYDHERDYVNDVKKHKGVVRIYIFTLHINNNAPFLLQPLNCTLVKLDGAYVTRPKTPHGIKHCFILHAPEKSNHRE